MKHLLRSSQWIGSATSRVLRAPLYSTNSQSASSSRDSLYRRVSQAGNPKLSIIPVLNQWLDEGKQVKKSDFPSLIRLLRHYSRFKHALEVSEWMSDEMNQSISPGDIAIRLDLISKVHGLEQAEKYFNSIPRTMRSFQLYSALLNCYAQKKCLEKAEATVQTMKELGFIKDSLSYNVMLKLYAQLGRHEKLDILMREMEEQGIDCDKFTFSTRLNAYSSTSDIEGMEKFLMKMEADPRIKVDSHTYVIAANGYLRAGLTEKSLQMMKRAEQLISDKTRKPAYEIFLTLYAAIGRKDEVYRIWNLYKKMRKFNNKGYMCMVSSLVKLEDFDGAEKIFDEWESGRTVYDARVPNILITAYCKRGLIEKAEAHMNRHVACEKEPDSFMWHSLATGYKISGQMTKAVESMKKAISASSPPMKLELNHLTLAACLEYLKGQGEVQAVDELLTLLNDKGYNEVVEEMNNRDLAASALDLTGGDDIALEQTEGDDGTLDGEKP